MTARQNQSTPGPELSPHDSLAGVVPQAPASAATTTDVALPCMDERTLERLTDGAERTRSVTLPVTAPALARAPFLVVLTGDHEGRVIKLPTAGTFQIGRAESCEFSLDDDGVSRVHARIVISGRSVMLEDAGSRNGTFVGTQAIRQHRLIGDEIIRIGTRTAIKFCFMDALEEDYLLRLLSAALKDALTGLYNRRHFDERVVTACAAARRNGEVFSLVLADIDNFKLVNDTYGHSVGDVALQKVAEALHRGARREDETFRYGGEEFALLMRNTPKKNAAEAAERIRRATENLVIRGSKDIVLKITLSLGVAEFGPGDDMNNLFAKADKALYAAKRATKNCVVIAS